MRIVALDLRPFRIAGPAARQAVCVVLRDESGRRSAGEAAPLPGFSQHTLEAAMHALHLAGPAIAAVAEDVPPAAAVERALAPHGAVLDACPTARFALETALFDLLAQRRGQDLASCLRDAPRVVDVVETSALLDIAEDPRSFVERALAALGRGFRVLKVKLRAADDTALDAEIEALRALRSEAPAFELRLDPNGRWSIDDARRRLARLAPLAPAFVEQPVPAHALAALGPCAVPWAADESLALGDIPAAFSRESGCAAFILKPAALGIGRARRLATLARARGLAVVITHFFDGPVGLAAASETALSLDADPLACGLDPHPGLRALAAGALPHHSEPTRVHPTGKPGLGLVPSDLGLVPSPWMP
jgi:L-alanine-DL-glutamate epimerase-like enolase superfamily enzyme